MRNATLMIVPNRKRRCYHYEQIRFLAENRSVDVIVCVMPNEMFDSITTSASDEDSKESELEHNFRRILKARCMHLGTPLQLVREKTILITKQAGDQQDPATKAWNFCTALYYKGNRTIPWRLVEDTAKLRSCYIGIGFYESRTGNGVVESGPGLRRVRARDHPSARRCRSTRRTVIRI
jgi:hypothetical protein